MNVFEELKEMILDYIDIDEDLITVNASWEEIGIDSIDLIEFIKNVETNYKIEISDEALEEFKTFEDLIDYVEAEV